MKQLKGFCIREQDDAFVLGLTDETGQTSEFRATAAEVDCVIDALDALLAEPEAPPQADRKAALRR